MAEHIDGPVRPGTAARLTRLLGATPRELLTVVGGSLALTLVWLAVIPVIDASRSGGDTDWYMKMAADPKDVSWAPSAFRGLEPWLAHAVGGQFHHLLAFRLLTWASLAAAGPAVYLVCRRLGGPHGAGLLGMAGLMCLPMWLFFIHQPYLVDGPAMALMAWTVVALVNGWLVLLPLLLALTGLARETVVGLAVPIYMWLRQRWLDVPTAVQVALFVAPALVLTWAIRQPMRYTGYQTTLGLMYAGVNYVKRDVLPNPQWWVFYGIAGSLSIWWLLGIAGRRHGGRLWWLLVPVFAQWLFGSDYARYALYAFPVVVAAGAIAVWEHPRRPLLLGLVGLQSLAVVADLVLRGHPRIYTLQPSTWIGGALMLLTAFVLWLPARRAAAPPAGTGPQAGVPEAVGAAPVTS